MRLFVRLSLVGLIVLVAIGFANNFLATYGESKSDATYNSEVTLNQGGCSGDGVHVVIDFGSKANAGVVNKCVGEFKGTSWDLLTAATLEVTGTQKYPVGFVCRINGFPAEEDEPCLDTPKPSVGSWAYFVAQPSSDSWQYSTWGAATHKALCGSAEAWLFKYQDENLETPPSIKPETSVCSSN